MIPMFGNKKNSVVLVYMLFRKRVDYGQIFFHDEKKETCMILKHCVNVTQTTIPSIYFDRSSIS